MNNVVKDLTDSQVFLSIIKGRRHPPNKKKHEFGGAVSMSEYVILCSSKLAGLEGFLCALNML